MNKVQLSECGSGEQDTFVTPGVYLTLIDFLAGYRIKMKVSDVLHLHEGSYYLCPRCKISLDRDYQKFCDRCGQRLDWAGCKKAKIVYPAAKNET